MQLSLFRIVGIAAVAGAMALASTASVRAETFTLRLATGHPPAQHYVELFQRYLAPQLKERVAARTEHKLNVLELYSGSAIKLPETITALEKGIVDIAGGCYCFHPADFPLHSFPVWMPFGTESPLKSLNIARDVYAVTPELSDVFEKKHNQKLIALITLDPYEIDSRRKIETMADLQGLKVGGAGPNLPWVSGAGAIPVQTTATIAYNALQTGVFDAIIGYVSFTKAAKLYEMAKYHTKVGFGSMTWLYVHMNLDTWNKLPPDVQKVVADTARDFEEVLAQETQERYGTRMAEIEAAGAEIITIPDELRKKWAEALKDWPNEKAKEVDKLGWPGSVVAKRNIEFAERHGHVWPVRYVIQ